MRLLRGVAGKVLSCGCLVGVYETYEGPVVATIDARGAGCDVPEHRRHAVLSVPGPGTMTVSDVTEEVHESRS